jgi:hypothetical protein
MARLALEMLLKGPVGDDGIADGKALLAKAGYRKVTATESRTLAATRASPLRPGGRQIYRNRSTLTLNIVARGFAAAFLIARFPRRILDVVPSSPVGLVLRLGQCDKENHGWREGPLLTVLYQTSIREGPPLPEIGPHIAVYRSQFRSANGSYCSICLLN